MKVLCFGSANLDHVYKVNHFTVPGETQGCLEYTVKCGGKGVNQAIAMSLAGNETYFAGIIGNDGTLLKDALVGKNVNIDYLKFQISQQDMLLLKLIKVVKIIFFYMVEQIKRLILNILMRFYLIFQRVMWLFYKMKSIMYLILLIAVMKKK